MLRAIFVLSIIAFGIVKSFGGPFYALLFYLWFAYFRPETWVWSDFVTILNISLFIGIVVLVWTLLSSEERIRVGWAHVLLILFLVQSTLSTFSSPVVNYALPYWQDFAKSTTICILMIALVNDERRLRLTLITISLSLGFEAIKQGWS